MNENRLSGTATVLIRRAAEDLISEVNGVRAVVVATADGFDVTSAWPPIERMRARMPSGMPARSWVE